MHEYGELCLVGQKEKPKNAPSLQTNFRTRRLIIQPGAVSGRGQWGFSRHSPPDSDIPTLRMAHPGA